LDQQPVAVFAVEKFIFLGKVGQGGEGSHAMPLRRRRTASPVSTAPKVLDLARQGILLVDGDPLKDVDPLLELLHLFAQPQRLGLFLGGNLVSAAAAPKAAIATVPIFGFEYPRDHDDRDDQDDHFKLV